MKEIPLTQGKFAIVDDEDFLFLNRFLWRVSGKGKKNNLIASTCISSKVINMYYFLVDYKSFLGKPFEVTHKNKDWLDYRKENLIVLTRSGMRQFNLKRKDNTSGYKGVWIHKGTGKAVAEIHKENKKYHLGYFETPKLAAIAYNKKALELFGKYAYQNKIEND